MLARSMSIVFLVAAMSGGALELTAQTKSRYELGFPYVGFWQVAPNGKDFTQATSCGPEHGGKGRCSVPLDRIKPYLHPRALAWMEFAGLSDEHLSPKWDCVMTPFPSALEDPFQLRMVSETQILITGAWDNAFTRVIHMDGRKHKDGYDRLSFTGDSIGWFEGDELVIQTANFSFDTDGLDDHLHLPSSQRKKVTERYKKTGPDQMTMTITHEDPLFLKKPFSWTIQFQKSDPSKVGVFGLPYEPTPCDVSAAHAELELIIDKYEGK